MNQKSILSAPAAILFIIVGSCSMRDSDENVVRIVPLPSGHAVNLHTTGWFRANNSEITAFYYTISDVSGDKGFGGLSQLADEFFGYEAGFNAELMGFRRVRIDIRNRRKMAGLNAPDFSFTAFYDRAENGTWQKQDADIIDPPPVVLKTLTTDDGEEVAITSEFVHDFDAQNAPLLELAGYCRTCNGPTAYSEAAGATFDLMLERGKHLAEAFDASAVKLTILTRPPDTKWHFSEAARLTWRQETPGIWGELVLDRDDFIEMSRDQIDAARDRADAMKVQAASNNSANE